MYLVFTVIVAACLGIWVWILRRRVWQLEGLISTVGEAVPGAAAGTEETRSPGCVAALRDAASLHHRTGDGVPVWVIE